MPDRDQRGQGRERAQDEEIPERRQGPERNREREHHPVGPAEDPVGPAGGSARRAGDPAGPIDDSARPEPDEDASERRRRRAQFLRELNEAKALRERVKPRQARAARMRQQMRMRTFRW